MCGEGCLGDRSSLGPDRYFEVGLCLPAQGRGLGKVPREVPEKKIR